MKRPPLKKPIAAFADSADDSSDEEAEKAQKAKKPLLVFDDDKATIDDPKEGEDSDAEAFEEDANRGKLRYRRGGGMRGFVPAGYDKEKAMADRVAAIEKRTQELERAKAALQQGEKVVDEVDSMVLDMLQKERQQSSDDKVKAIRTDLEDDGGEEARELQALEQIRRRNAELEAQQQTNPEFARAAQDEWAPDVDEEDALDESKMPADWKEIAPLPEVDHSLIEYAPFEKCFYHQLEDGGLMEEETIQKRSEWDLSVSSLDPVMELPCLSFSAMQLPRKLEEAVRQSPLWSEPTPIQAQAIPCAMAGRDLLAVAKTGSGKTLAYLLPLLVHISHQPAPEKREGPVGLVLAPTRELAHQIYAEMKPLAKALQLRVMEVVGGVAKAEQIQRLRNDAPCVVVATPGRWIEMVRKKATSMTRVTFMVVDEADRMLDLGFEKQVSSVVHAARPDRQLLLFSATLLDRVETLAHALLTDPVRMVMGHGRTMEADQTLHASFPTDVDQWFQLFLMPNQKLPWLLKELPSMLRHFSQGSVLIFVAKKETVDEVQQKLNQEARIPSLGLHGDLRKDERSRIMQQFKRNDCRILVATDLASRGLDIAHLQVVINYDLPRDMESYIHRIGRTGRKGQAEQLQGGKGLAVTLITEREAGFASKLCHFLRQSSHAKRFITPELEALAERAKIHREMKAIEKGIAAPTALYQSELKATANVVPASMRSGWQHHFNPEAVEQVPIWKRMAAEPEEKPQESLPPKKKSRWDVE